MGLSPGWNGLSAWLSPGLQHRLTGMIRAGLSYTSHVVQPHREAACDLPCPLSLPWVQEHPVVPGLPCLPEGLKPEISIGLAADSAELRLTATNLA